MMNRKQRALLISLIFLFSAYSAEALETCSSYKYVHVNLNLAKFSLSKLSVGANLNEFNGAQGAYDEFNPTTTYDSTHVCGLFVHTEVSMWTDGKSIIWSAPGGMIKKDGTSLKSDLSGYYQVCGDEDCSKSAEHYGACINDRCRYTSWVAEDVTSGEAGGDAVFGYDYGEVSDAGSETDLAAPSIDDPTKKMYRPKYDLLCSSDGSSGGKWYACDRDAGCTCVNDYSCGNSEPGKWEFCQYGCDALTGKCKGNEPKEFCKDQSLTPASDIDNPDAGSVLDGTSSGCDMKVVLSAVNDVSVNVKIDRGGESTFEEIDVGSDWTQTVDKTTYTVSIKSLDPGKTASLNACCSTEPEPKPSPTPVTGKTCTQQGYTCGCAGGTCEQEDAGIKGCESAGQNCCKKCVSSTKENIKPTPPEPVCKPYYEVMTVKDETTDNPVVTEPDECKYTQTIDIDRADNCKKTGGDLADEKYEKIDIPVCASSIKTVKDVGKDVFGSPYDSEKERKKKLGLACDGTITNVDWEIAGQDITLWVDARSSANDSGDYGDGCEYMVCLYNSNGGRIKCGEDLTGEWQARAEGEVFRTTFSSMGLQQFLSLDTYLGWDITNLGGNFEIRLYSKDKNVPEALVESQVFSLCRENFLTLCTTTETQKKYWLFGDEVNKTIYRGVNSAEFMNLATKNADKNSTTWLLDNILYRTMDAKNCLFKDAYGQPSQVKYYTIANDPAYRTLVNGTYGNESFYRKFLNMSEDADYLYCYKTDLWNTSICNELNYDRYSFTRDNNVEQIGIDYRENLKTWNAQQVVDELSTLDMGRAPVTPEYDPHPCSVSLDKDYYKALDNMSITYTNAPGDCTMYLYPMSKDEADEAVAKWSIDGSGTQSYALKETDPLGNYSAVINCGECYVKDTAYVNVSTISNVMSRIFTVSPYLEDIRNKMTWTETGNDTLYGGAGFERYDRCSLSCDAKNPFRLLAGCTNAEGAERLECANCTDKGDCTVDSKGNCPGTKGDCWDKVCQVRTRNYGLEAEPGKKDESFHGVPYNGECPAGFPKKPISVGYYTRPADDAQWSNSIDAPEQGQSATKCVLDGGVIATTTFDFSPPGKNAPDAEMIFIIDTSDSMVNYWKKLCGSIDTVIQNVAAKGITAKYTIYTLGAKNAVTAVCSSEEVKKNLQELQCSEIQGAVDQQIVCNDPQENCKKESWGPATSWASKSHSWTEGARKIILPISDEAAYCGTDLLSGETSESASKSDNTSVDEAIKNAKDNGASVYSLWAGANAAVQAQMKKLSDATGGKASEFSQSDIASQLEKILLEANKPIYVVASNATIYMNQTAPNVWVLYQNESQNVSVNVSKIGTTGEESGEESRAEELNLTIYPSLLLVETANMPFNITYVNISRNGSRYNITRIYVPNESAEEYGQDFIVTSKIIFNYTVLDSAETFTVNLNNSYYTQIRRDKSYVACDQKTCSTVAGMNYTLAASGTDKTASCGGISSKGEGDTKTYRRETETELLDREYSEKDTLKTDALSHQSALCGTLDELTIEGTIDEYYDGQGNLIMYTASENPLRITISPDILGGFTFVINDSAIVYSSLYYPARHQLTRKESAPYSDREWSSLDDKYGYEDERFGYPRQCKKTCPATECSCPAGDPLKTTCMDFNQQALVERTDCSCVPQDCYPNPCVSNRTYHEYEGSIIGNGDFETGDLSMWEKTGDSSEAEVNLSGHSGYMLKLLGGVNQTIANLSTNPYNEICVEYALNEYKKGGSINLTVTLNGTDTSFSVWNDSEECSDCLGWNKKCFPVNGRISNVKVDSSVEAFIDNLNLGKYYDYASINTYSTPRFEYMDQHFRGWESFGMLKTTGVAHTANTYSFEFETMPRVYMESRNFSVPKESASDVKGELDAEAGKAASDSSDSLKALRTVFQDNGIALSIYARIEKGGSAWSVIDGDRVYSILEDTGGNLNIANIGFDSISLAEDDYKNGIIQLKTFFKDIIIPLSPNVVEDKSAEDPVCYTMNVTFRRPSKLSVEVSPNGYTIQAGTRVTATYKLTLYDGTPLPNEKVYVDLAGADIWSLSPEGAKKDYMFSFQEIISDTQQQEKLTARLISLGHSETAKSMEKAQYSADGSDKIKITANGVTSTLEATDGICHLILDNDQDIIVGVTEDYEGKLLVYESTEQKNLGYITTDENGVAQWSFKPTGTSVGGSSPGGSTSSPSKASTGIHTVSLKSPLFSGEFLLLALILVLGVFSYRYFGSGKIDFYSWWRDFRGKK